MILLCYGTRPEWIKLKPLIKEMRENKIEFKILFTSQQKDIAESSEADHIHIINDDNNNRLDSIIKSCLSLPNNFFENINKIIVQGDTATAFGLALAAFHRKINIIHLEAGLRTYDKNNPYPEEIYRQMISRMADLNLCPTNINVKNLNSEFISGNIVQVGNTVIDNLVSASIKSNETNIILITLHRRENHDIMNEWFEQINNLAKENPNLKFILPIHPNPNVKKHANLLTNVNVIDPVPHNELIQIIADSKLIITDSGGIQEEASFFNKKVIVCRKTTERPESLSLTSFLCYNPKKLIILFNKLINMEIQNYKCPYGEGDSSKQIIKLIS